MTLDQPQAVTSPPPAPSLVPRDEIRTSMLVREERAMDYGGPAQGAPPGLPRLGGVRAGMRVLLMIGVILPLVSGQSDHIDKRFDPQTVDQCFGQTIPIQCDHGEMVQVTKVFYRQSQKCRGSFHSNFCTREEASNPACVGNATCTFTTPYIYLSPECGYSNNFLVTYKCIPGYLSETTPECGYSNNFLVTYKCIPGSLPRDVCEEGTLTAHSGYVVSPSYPAKYPAGRNCKVTVTTSPGTVIQVYLLDLYLAYYNYDVTKQCVDTLWIVGLGETDRTGYLCSGKQRGLIFTSQANKITIYFTSKGHRFLNAKGFWLFYQAVSKTNRRAVSTTAPMFESHAKNHRPMVKSREQNHRLVTDSHGKNHQSMTESHGHNHQPMTESHGKINGPVIKSNGKTHRPITAPTEQIHRPMTESHGNTQRPMTASTTQNHRPVTESHVKNHQPMTESHKPTETPALKADTVHALRETHIKQQTEDSTTKPPHHESSTTHAQLAPVTPSTTRATQRILGKTTETTNILKDARSKLKPGFVKSTVSTVGTPPMRSTTEHPVTTHVTTHVFTTQSTQAPPAGDIHTEKARPTSVPRVTSSAEPEPPTGSVRAHVTALPTIPRLHSVDPTRHQLTATNASTTEHRAESGAPGVESVEAGNSSLVVVRPARLGTSTSTSEGRLRVPLWGKEPPSHSAVFFRKISDTTRKGIVGGAGGFLVLMLAVIVIVILLKRRQNNKNLAPPLPPGVKAENYDDIILAYGSNDTTKGFINVGFENESVHDLPMDTSSQSSGQSSLGTWGGTLTSCRGLNPIDEGPEIVYMDAKTATLGGANKKRSKCANKVRWVKSKSLDDIRHTIRYTQRQMARSSLRPRRDDRQPFSASAADWLDHEEDAVSDITTSDVNANSELCLAQSETTLYSNSSTTETPNHQFSFTDKTEVTAAYETVHFQHQDEVAL